MTILIDQAPIDVQQGELAPKSGFSMPTTNAFGQTFRDYEAESLRKKTVEEFYRVNHTYQTVDFVGAANLPSPFSSLLR